MLARSNVANMYIGMRDRLCSARAMAFCENYKHSLVK